MFARTLKTVNLTQRVGQMQKPWMRECLAVGLTHRREKRLGEAREECDKDIKDRGGETALMAPSVIFYN